MVVIKYSIPSIISILSVMCKLPRNFNIFFVIRVAMKSVFVFYFWWCPHLPYFYDVAYSIFHYKTLDETEKHQRLTDHECNADIFKESPKPLWRPSKGVAVHAEFRN